MMRKCIHAAAAYILDHDTLAPVSSNLLNFFIALIGNLESGRETKFCVCQGVKIKFNYSPKQYNNYTK